MEQEEGLYLCNVNGLQYCDYAILKWDDGVWWQYYRDFTQTSIEGWIGNDLEIIDIIKKLD